MNNHLERLPEKETLDFNGRHFWDFLLCKGLMNEKEAVKRSLEIRLEEGNVIGHPFVYGIENQLYLHLSQEELRPFKQAEEKIIREQRNNVISYLKKEGEWKEEWSVQ